MNRAQFLVPKQHLPAFAVSIAAVSCISPTLLFMRLTWSFPREEPVSCLGLVAGCPGWHEGRLDGPEQSPLSLAGLWLWRPTAAPGWKALGQPAPQSARDNADPTPVQTHAWSPELPAPPRLEQQVCVLSNSSLPSEGLRN